MLFINYADSAIKIRIEWLRADVRNPNRFPVLNPESLYSHCICNHIISCYIQTLYIYTTHAHIYYHTHNMITYPIYTIYTIYTYDNLSNCYHTICVPCSSSTASCAYTTRDMPHLPLLLPWLLHLVPHLSLVTLLLSYFNSIV